MIKAYYKNSKGEVLWLTKAPFRTVEADWFDSTWEENGVRAEHGNSVQNHFCRR